MAITDEQLDLVVQEWNRYVQGTPGKIATRNLLEKRDLRSYRGLGIAVAGELGQRMVDDRSVATFEMAMGHLYELVLEALGPRKVTSAQKKIPGFRGIDFDQTTHGEFRVVNLKAGLSTSNGDITDATKRNLRQATDYWTAHPIVDDNPLRQQSRQVVMIRAVARGPWHREVTPEGILWLVGDATWDYFGGGENLLLRLGEAMGRNPLNYQRYKDMKDQAALRVETYLVEAGLAAADGIIDWPKLLTEFP